MNIKSLNPSKSSRYKQGYINNNSCKKLFPGLERTKIIFRSSYELKFIQWLENNNDVKYWGSECFWIPYFSVLDGKTHKYYPDYFVEMNNGKYYVIEIKPYSQTKKPNIINENNWYNREYIKNQCKWKATIEYCKNKGFTFKVLTEKTIENL